MIMTQISYGLTQSSHKKVPILSLELMLVIRYAMMLISHPSFIVLTVRFPTTLFVLSRKKASNIKLQLPTTTASSLSSVLLARGKITSPPAYMELINTFLHICGVAISIKSTSKSTYSEIQESIPVIPPMQNYLANMTSMLAPSHLLGLKLSSSNQERIEPPPILITESMAGILGLALIKFKTIKFM